MLVRCINCGFSCQKYGKTKAGSQRWHCKQCNITFTQTIDNTTK
ncbi:MAG: IS256 family transposase, partial [Veillonella sp.]|nr:IS256 family transposase [Veillonella sp.]